MATQLTPEALALVEERNARVNTIKASLVLGDHVKKTDLPQYCEYRTLYPILRNGDLVAFLGMKQGWGKGWRIWELQLAPAGARLNIQGCQPHDRNDHYVYKKEYALEKVAELMAMFPDKFKSRQRLQEAVSAMKTAELASARDYLKSLQDGLARLQTEWDVLGKLGTDKLTLDEIVIFNGICARVSSDKTAKDAAIQRQRVAVHMLEKAMGVNHG